MKKSFEEKLKQFLNENRPRLLTDKRFVIKSCFGAKAGYWCGNIFVTYGSFGVALKLPRSTVENLIKKRDGKPLQYFKNGHVKRDYVVLLPLLSKDKSRLTYLLTRSLELASSS